MKNSGSLWKKILQVVAVVVEALVGIFGTTKKTR